MCGLPLLEPERRAMVCRNDMIKVRVRACTHAPYCTQITFRRRMNLPCGNDGVNGSQGIEPSAPNCKDAVRKGTLQRLRTSELKRHGRQGTQKSCSMTRSILMPYDYASSTGQYPTTAFNITEAAFRRIYSSNNLVRDSSIVIRSINHAYPMAHPEKCLAFWLQFT
jgi:hypothetical protein